MTAGHEITIRPSDHHVEVKVGGETVAVSNRPVVLEETGLPPRYYLPKDDVRMDLLRPTATTSTCPFKGQASYWAVEVGGHVVEDAAWSYESPIADAEGITGLLSFYPDRVEVRIGG